MVQKAIVVDLGQWNGTINPHVTAANNDSAISSFLRAQAAQKAIPNDLHFSQHSVSTLGSVNEDDLSESWAAEDDSASFLSINDEDIFTSATGVHEENQLREDEHASSYDQLIAKALLISDGEESCSSYDQGWYESVEALKMEDDPVYAEIQPAMMASTNFHSDSSATQSVASLNEAFLKLNACMVRTEESRRRVLGLKANSCMLDRPSDSLGAATTLGGCHVRDDRSVRSSSSKSLCSKESLGQKKISKTYKKKPRRRRGTNKPVTIVNKTGVAFRPSHMSLL